MFNKKEILKMIHECAVSYSKLLSKKVIIESNYFMYRAKYTIIFEKRNFAHLTGMLAKGPRAIFYEKALDKTLTFDDFNYLSSRWVKYVKNKKLINLRTINNFFARKIEVVERFRNGKVECCIAVSNGNYTLGFDGNDKLRIRTILDGDKIDKSKRIKKASILIFKNDVI